MSNTANVFETIMIICFGLSWPMSIERSWKSCSTNGKSLMFMVFIWIGYVCGITSKILMHNFNLAYWFYYPNIIMVSIDISLYFRNKKIERAKAVC